LNKQRWIYSCSKQLLDRVICAYGQEQGFDYTLFLPFNWIGPGLDSIHTPKEGSSRVVTQFLGHIARGESIKLVDGGQQRRSFTFVSDGIDALIRIIKNENGKATGSIYNIGNPANDLSIRELAELMLKIAKEHPEYQAQAAKVELIDTNANDYYGKGYQDIKTRVPWIGNTMDDLGWKPEISVEDALRNIFDVYSHEVAAARELIDQDQTL
ncbi:MAG: bifunctional UDP-4-keto-pentose/UDP-xylose synthase, partial [Methylobacter sp.]|nr:bifunctional UDP-4-keto-pentose/UDP-xylose synthase [Methylobacter sp.]